MAMRVFLVLLSVVLVAGLLGCTVTKTRSEHSQSYKQQYDLENRQLVEDIDTWWMADRPSRLSKWEVR